MSAEPAPTGPPRSRHAGLAAAASAALAFAVYAWGAAPTVLPGDAAELASVAWKGGVAHTPGYPTYVLLGQVAAALLPGDPSHRLAVFSAAMGACSVGLLALLLAEFAFGAGAILLGALGFAAMFTLWWASIRVEVYTLGLALALFALWRVFVARRTLRASDGTLAAFAIGLALTVHVSFAPLLAVAGAWLVVEARRAGRLSRTVVLASAVALLLGLTPYLYLPWADAHHLLTNHLRVNVEAAGGQYGLTPERFDGVFERMVFLVAGPEASPRALARHLPTALGNLGVASARFVLFECGPLVLLLAAFGARDVLRRDRAGALVLLAGGALPALLGAVAVDGALLNVFMLSTAAAVAVFATGAYERLSRRGSRGIALALALAVMLVAAAIPHELRVRSEARPLFGVSWLTMPVEGPPSVRTRIPQFRGEERFRREGLAVLDAIPESSFVAARWDRVTVLKYLQNVEGRRPDLWLDPWYEPSHVARLARWQRRHDLATHPVVIVDSIAGLRERLAAPEVKRLADGITLAIERAAVDTTLAR